MYAPRHQVKFLVRVKLPGDKPDSDSDSVKGEEDEEEEGEEEGILLRCTEAVRRRSPGLRSSRGGSKIRRTAGGIRVSICTSRQTQHSSGCRREARFGVHIPASSHRSIGGGAGSSGGLHLCYIFSTFHFIMSTEEGEACGGEEVKGGETLPHSHTWGEGEPHGGGERRLNPGEEKEEEPGEEEEARSCRDACDGGHFSREEEEEEVGVLGGRSCKEQTMHSNSSSETCIPTPSCRICFQGAEQGALLNPCRCDGSVRYTHQTCLLKWISERGCWTCELCCYRFSVIAINTKNPWQWQSITITLVEKVQIIAVFLGSLFLVASISWLLWSALSPQAVWQRRDVLFQICYGMYSFMDLVCVGLIVHEGAAVYSVFLRWRAVNLHWDVQSYNKAKDLEETSTGQSALSPRTLWLPLTTFAPDGPLRPGTQLEVQPWSCLCLGPFCHGLGPRNPLRRDRDSGQEVIRVTSV